MVGILKGEPTMEELAQKIAYHGEVLASMQEQAHEESVKQWLDTSRSGIAAWLGQVQVSHTQMDAPTSTLSLADAAYSFVVSTAS